MRRRKPEPWFTDIPARLRFQAAARREFPGLQERATGRGRDAVITYRLRVSVPHYKDREITIRLANYTEAYCLSVTADGPTASPHRYDEHRLCMWKPSDPPDQRWVAEDGLLALIRHAQVHLFKEAHWRETGKWVGPQAPHDGPKEAHG